jgi:hypothetical protein
MAQARGAELQRTSNFADLTTPNHVGPKSNPGRKPETLPGPFAHLGARHRYEETRAVPEPTGIVPPREACLNG